MNGAGVARMGTAPARAASVVAEVLGWVNRGGSGRGSAIKGKGAGSPWSGEGQRIRLTVGNCTTSGVGGISSMVKGIVAALPRSDGGRPSVSLKSMRRRPMTFQGRVKNGVVILTNGCTLPDGSLVNVMPIDENPGASSQATGQQGPYAVSKEQKEALLGLIGTWKMERPPDDEDVQRIIEEARMTKYG